MKRKFNFTKRQRILKQNVRIILEGEEGSKKISEVSCDLKDLSLNPVARVYLEAYHRAEHKRFDLGTVQDLKTVNGLELSPMAYSDNLKFRILVVDETQQKHGLIIAHADGIKAVGENEQPAHSLLPVQFEDTAQEIWRIRYEDQGGGPILYINNRIPNIEARARRDPSFIMFVYPQVLRNVLTKILLIDRHDFSEELDTWKDEWIMFAKMSAHIDNPPYYDGEDYSSESIVDMEKWIDSAVEGFSYSRREWDGFIASMSQDRGE